MQYNLCFIVHTSIVIKDTLTGTKNLPLSKLFLFPFIFLIKGSS